MYLFGYIRYIRPHIDYGETVLVGAGAVFISFDNYTISLISTKWFELFGISEQFYFFIT